MKKRLLAVMLAVCLMVGCLPLSAWAVELKGNHERALSSLYDNSYDDLFYPADTTLLAQADKYGFLRYKKNINLAKNFTMLDICEILAGGFGPVDGLDTSVTIDLPYTDCKDLTNLQKAAIKWAEYYRIINETDRQIFGVETTILRNVMAAILWNTAGRPESTLTGHFSDVYGSQWYFRPVNYLYEKGIFTTEKDCFYPLDTISSRDALRWIIAFYEQAHNGAVSTVEIPQDDITVKIGDTVSLSAEISPRNTATEIAWSSSDENIAAVRGNAVIGTGEGVTTIIAQLANGNSASVQVTVIEDTASSSPSPTPSATSSPTPIPTASPTPLPRPTLSESEEMESFLYGYRWWHASYDCNNPTVVDKQASKNIFEAALSFPTFSLLNDGLYPGESWKLYRYGEFDQGDPLGRFPNGYAKINQKKLKWILRNIYNVPSYDIDTMERNALAKPGCSFYQYQGYYYFEGGYLAPSGSSVRDIEIRPNGVYYNVSYNYIPNSDYLNTPSKWENCSAVFERKTIDGVTYWAMRSHSGQNDSITSTPTPTLSPDVLNVTESTDEWGLTRITIWMDGHKATKKYGYGSNITVINPNSSVIAYVNLLTEPSPGKNFTDVKDGSWYKSYVDKATGYDLFSGTSSTQFSPNAPMTRAMLATVLYRLSGNVKYGLGSGSFSDVPANAWYKDAVDWAQATGIVSGTGNGKFNPNGKVTREQLITMLYHYANLIGEYSGNMEYLSSFPDAHKVSGWATKSMDWAVAKGFIKGRNGNIVPQGTATRAEVASILIQFIDFINFKDNPSAFYICKRCGKSTTVVPISRYGYCDECYDIILARSCQICGKKIREIDCDSHADYIVKWNNYICSDCYCSYYCPTCQKVSTNVWEGYCDVCDPGPRCKNCGVRGFGRGLTDNGYCWDCYESLFS